MSERIYTQADVDAIRAYYRQREREIRQLQEMKTRGLLLQLDAYQNILTKQIEITPLPPIIIQPIESVKEPRNEQTRKPIR